MFDPIQSSPTKSVSRIKVKYRVSLSILFLQTQKDCFFYICSKLMLHNIFLRKGTFSVFVCINLDSPLRTSHDHLQFFQASSTVRKLNMMEKEISLDLFKKDISNKCPLIKNKTQVYFRARSTFRPFLVFFKSYFYYNLLGNYIQ